MSDKHIKDMQSIIEEIESAKRISEKIDIADVTLGIMGKVPKVGETWEFKDNKGDGNDLYVLITEVANGLVGYNDEESVQMHRDNTQYNSLSFFRFVYRKSENYKIERD